MKKSISPLFQGVINQRFIFSFFAIVSLVALTVYLITKEEKFAEAEEEDFVALYI